MQDLKKIDEQLARLSKSMSRYDIINPQNKQEEYEKFISAKDSAKGKYNPQFTYKTINVKPIIEELLTLHIETNTELGKLFKQFHEDLLEETKALDNIGTDDFLITKKFGKLSKEELQMVYDTLAVAKEETTTDDEVKIFSASQLGEKIEEKLENYGLKGWTITYSKTSLSRVAINKNIKTIIIREQEEFTAQDIKKLLVHEIETHILRWYNGTQQAYNIFAIGTHHYLTTEEGLAGYNEFTQGVARIQAKRNYAVMALATHLAATKSFSEIFEIIRPHVRDDESCFRIVTRVKRGLGDTSKPGGYLKDHIYFQGYLQIRQFIKQGGNIKDLYAGKISINNLNLITQGILRKPKIIPGFL